jgi:23S rRNA pseudouridine955/2504/2580 synthase
MALVLSAGADDNGRRLDRVLRKALGSLPLSAIHRLLRKGAVRVEGEPAAADCRVLAGQTITVNADAAWPPAPPAGFPTDRTAGAAAPGSLDILYEGEGLLVLNKPAGLVVHGRGSLEDLALPYLGPKLPPSLSFRPGPLHRLDAPSSGVIAFSASLEGARLFSGLMRERSIRKSYLALVEGVLREAELWEDGLVRDKKRKKTFRAGAGGGDSQKASTRVTPLLANLSNTLILAEIETGRTHQIRAQAAARGFPLLGDRKYGGRGSGEGIYLHAWRMEFPELSPFPRIIEAPLPERFGGKIKSLFGKGALESVI